MPNTPKAQEPTPDFNAIASIVEIEKKNLHGIYETNLPLSLEFLYNSPAALNALGLVKKEDYAALAASHGELLESLTYLKELGKRDLTNPKYDGFFSAIKVEISTAEALQSSLPLKGAE